MTDPRHQCPINGHRIPLESFRVLDLWDILVGEHDSSNSYQQPPISGSGALYMEYVGGLNQLVLIVDEMSPNGLDGEVLTKVAELIESGVAPVFEECIFDRQLLPLFVWCECCGV